MISIEAGKSHRSRHRLPEQISSPNSAPDLLCVTSAFSGPQFPKHCINEADPNPDFYWPFWVFVQTFRKTKDHISALPPPPPPSQQSNLASEHELENHYTVLEESCIKSFRDDGQLPGSEALRLPGDFSISHFPPLDFSPLSWARARASCR